MEENKVLIDLKRYDELLTAETELQLAKAILFNQKNRLYYNKQEVAFEIDYSQVKLVFPTQYHLHLLGLQKKEEENV